MVHLLLPLGIMRVRTFLLDIEAVHLAPQVVAVDLPTAADLFALLLLRGGTHHEDAAVVIRLPLLAVGVDELT